MGVSSKLVRTLVGLGLASVLVGSTPDCGTVLWIEGGSMVTTPRDRNGGTAVGSRHPTHFESTPTMRLEMFGQLGDQGPFPFELPEEIEDLEQLGSSTVTNATYGRWWSFGQHSLNGEMALDFIGALSNDYLPDDLVDYATTTEEGRCSVTVPWRTENMDTDLAALVGESFGDGLAQVIVDGFDRGMAPRLGSQDAIEDQAWFADFSSSLNPDPGRPTQLVADWRIDEQGGASHRTCVRSYFLFDGAIDWSPNGAGEVFQWIAGGWIPSVFQIGNCPGSRSTAITVCGQFDVTREGDQTYDGTELVPAAPGELTFRVDEVRASMNRYPRIRVACNNAKPDIERGIEEVFASLIGPSFGAMARGFTDTIPFGFERAHQSAEGVTLVIADDEDDPDAVLADWLGLCGPRMPQNGIYTNVLWEGELPAP